MGVRALVTHTGTLLVAATFEDGALRVFDPRTGRALAAHSFGLAPCAFPVTVAAPECGSHPLVLWRCHSAGFRHRFTRQRGAGLC